MENFISFNPVTSTHLHFHNDLLCYPRSRSSLHSGYSCPSPAWRCFYYSYIVYRVFVFVDPELIILVNPKLVVLVDSKSIVLVDPELVVILVQQQQRLPMLRDSYAVSAR